MKLEKGYINWVSKEGWETKKVFRTETSEYILACYAKDESEAFEIFNSFAADNDLDQIIFAFEV